MIPTPKNVIEELDKYIVGQPGAKKAVAIALCNRERRRRLDPDMRREVLPKNIILIGSTGVGKTEIARRIAAMIDAPFVKVEATKFTEVGYVGRDVDSIIAELTENTVSKVYEDKVREVEERAESLATERLVGYVCQQLPSAGKKSGAPDRRGKKRLDRLVVAAAGGAGAHADGKRSRQKIASLLRSNELDDQLIEIEVGEEDNGPYHEFAADFEEPREDPADTGQRPRAGYSQKRRRKVSIKEARRILTREEAGKLIDYDHVIDTSLHEIEENGVVFLDELDKLVAPRVDFGRDVSGEGVQRDLLPLVEGSTVMTRYGPVKTDHILFIAAGCFYQSKPSDLIPELQGRFPLRVELSPLGEDDLVKILVEPKNSLTKQYKALLATEGVTLEFTEDGLRQIAKIAVTMNGRSDNIGARRLNTVMERVLEEVNFSAPDVKGETVTVDRQYVLQRTGGLVEDENFSRYIL